MHGVSCSFSSSASKIDPSPFRPPRGFDAAEQGVATERVKADVSRLMSQEFPLPLRAIDAENDPASMNALMEQWYS